PGAYPLAMVTAQTTRSATSRSHVNRPLLRPLLVTRRCSVANRTRPRASWTTLSQKTASTRARRSSDVSARNLRSRRLPDFDEVSGGQLAEQREEVAVAHLPLDVEGL